MLFALLAVSLVAMWALIVEGHNGWAVACFVVACALAWLDGIFFWFMVAAVVAGAWTFPDWFALREINERLKRH